MSSVTKGNYKVLITEGGEKAYVLERGKRIPEPQYVKIYLHTLGKYSKLNANCIRIFMALCTRIDRDDNSIRITPTDRKELCLELGLAVSSFNTYMSRLLSAGFMKKVDYGMFIINPTVATCTDWKRSVAIYEKVFAKMC